MREDDVLSIVRVISNSLEETTFLQRLSKQAGYSPFYLQRRFKAVTGESPKTFSSRLRLERAAAKLMMTDQSILSIALDAGYQSHEVFLRAFARQFGMAPRAFRQRAKADHTEARRRTHIEAVTGAAPCLGLYRISTSKPIWSKKMTTPNIERRDLDPQPILYIQRELTFSSLQETMGECFGKLYGYGQSKGLAIVGQPIARYVKAGPGLWTVDFVMPLAAPAEGNGEMVAGNLHAGPVAYAMHNGPYEQLSETGAAIERWIKDNGYEVAGPPWESYVTDPASEPDPAKWRTDVFWPLKS